MTASPVDWYAARAAGVLAYVLLTGGVLLGTLPHSSRVRGVISPSMDQAHLVEAIDDNT